MRRHLPDMEESRSVAAEFLCASKKLFIMSVSEIWLQNILIVLAGKTTTGSVFLFCFL